MYFSLKFSSPPVTANQLEAPDFPPCIARAHHSDCMPCIFPRKVLFSCISKKGRVVRSVGGRGPMAVSNLTSHSKWDCHQHTRLTVALSSWALKTCKSVNSAASLSSFFSPSLGSIQKAYFSFLPEMFILIQLLNVCTPETTDSHVRRTELHRTTLLWSGRLHTFCASSLNTRSYQTCFV